jgi:hypothetical protein
MADNERAQSREAPEAILSSADLQRIGREAREQVAREQQRREKEWEMRDRPAPPWDGCSPWRSLGDTYVACFADREAISIDNLETILSRGRVPISGSRNDAIRDTLPAPVEHLVGAAEKLIFDADSSSIWAAYSEPPDRVALFGEQSSLRYGFSGLTIMFTNVLVHWPKLADELQAAGFKIKIGAALARTENFKQRHRSAKKNRPGPKRGTISRFGESDRTLFAQIEQMMTEKHVSHTEAARTLAESGMVVGRGSKESIARRLATRYRTEKLRQKNSP